jgi:hypothetical protein
VGTRGGAFYKYNMQSGQPRGSYPPSATPLPRGQTEGIMWGVSLMLHTFVITVILLLYLLLLLEMQLMCTVHIGVAYSSSSIDRAVY